MISVAPQQVFFMKKLALSCFIISKNEADRIAQTIRSVASWVDEVVVVDSESTDATVHVATTEGCRVITQPWLGFGPQKRFAEDQCRHPWVLNLDADEVVTPALREEIIAAFANGDPAEIAYAIPLDLVYPGEERPRPWARDHLYVRLYDRRVVRFRDSLVHDAVVTGDRAVGVLRAPAFHYSFRTYADLKRKLAERMLLSAEHANCSSRMALLARLVLEFPINFLKYYVTRRHFTGGLKGLRYAWIQASFRQVKVAHMWRTRYSRHRTMVRRADQTSPLPEFVLRPQTPPAGEIYAERA
ncbi:glycosyltransferase family 2 protein [Hyphomicrobium sp.]|uniref:glycosyltransferase family 2 protein n=1 Tax=Hyphomicrobium sp. TaxID=82 RepID=UPI00356B4378